jgi:putative redox protein
MADILASVNGTIGRDKYRTTLTAGEHTVFADEPEEDGGTDTAMSPYQLLLSSLGACTVVTLRMYADRKEWNVDSIKVSLNLSRDMVNGVANSTITRDLEFEGAIDEEQKQRLVQIANACPVHKILTGNISIQTQLAE